MNDYENLNLTYEEFTQNSISKNLSKEAVSELIDAISILSILAYNAYVQDINNISI